MKNNIISFCLLAIIISGCASSESMPGSVTMSKSKLMDKIKGGWAGQTIGCTYGGPTEFRYPGTMINDNIEINYPDHYLKWYYDNSPGLYDDVYMDLTFVNVYDRLGLDAPVDSFAVAFANAGYPLWHANQAARYNILNGMMPPQSGYWENNPHADDIDFQIEADYAGLMSPGMPQAAAKYSDGIGHIMNYGDGWYGGVYVSTMYALAFISDDINYIVKEALKSIPVESKYYKCMSDVIKWHSQYPNDWEITWSLIQKNYSFDIACPDGVYNAFDIDATINSAYILVGLLYGQGDWDKTLEYATRCGQDSDCNPASAGGILGCMLGYSNIPKKWMANLNEVEDLNFAYTDISLNKTYEMSFNQALKVIALNGGEVKDSSVTIKCQAPVPVRLEQSFEGYWPKEKNQINIDLNNPDTIKFNGIGIVLGYRMMNKMGENDKYVAKVEIYLDGQLSETVSLPTNFTSRRQELYYKYKLSDKDHFITLKWLNPDKNVSLNVTSDIVYKNTK